MDWKLLDESGEFIQEVNCQYDACDISHWDHGASKIEINFTNKSAKILEKEAVINE